MDAVTLSPTSLGGATEIRAARPLPGCFAGGGEVLRQAFSRCPTVGAGQGCFPVRLMCSQPSGETWTRSSIGEPQRPDGDTDLVADLYWRLPEARITDILLEVDHAATGFTEAFENPAGVGHADDPRVARIRDVVAEQHARGAQPDFLHRTVGSQVVAPRTRHAG